MGGIWRLQGPEVPRIIGRYSSTLPENVCLLPQRRYNKNEYYCYAKRLTLPSSKATVKIICNDAGAMIRSLLNKNSKKDYLFHDDDPFAPPHLETEYIRDINSRIETCEQRITNPDRQILLPVPMYADGCVPGAISSIYPSPSEWKLPSNFEREGPR
jgi:hypothetical protein